MSFASRAARSPGSPAVLVRPFRCPPPPLRSRSELPQRYSSVATAGTIARPGHKCDTETIRARCARLIFAHRWRRRDRGPASAAALSAAQRAEEMARYTATLLEPWRRRVEEQAEEIGALKTKLDYAVDELAARDATGEEVGRLKAEPEQARQRITEFEAISDQLEQEPVTAAAAAARRPWWRFWD